MHILDPACGSGSFLIGAYQRLLDWHLEQYSKDDPEKHAKGKPPRLFQDKTGEWRLTLEERKRILLDNIYGVDIDSQAVEVTKLSLLLKVLEGEMPGQLSFLPERALPDLGNNIKCGNSLIGPDFYEGVQMGMFDEEERYRINVFDWEAEFKEIFEAGGFDTVIGNPPWGADISDVEKPYFRKNYRLNSGKFESYIFFIERASQLINKMGQFGFIVPSYWISRSQTEAVRNHLYGELWPTSLIILPENVFSSVKMDSSIIVASWQKEDVLNISEISKEELREVIAINSLNSKLRRIKLDDWAQNKEIRFNPRVTSQDISILTKIENSGTDLGDEVEISQGLTLYRRSTLEKEFGKAKANEIVSKRLFHSNYKKDVPYKKELLGRDVSRYFVKWNGKSWVSYGPWLAHAVDERFFHGPRLVIQKLRNPMLKQRLVVGYLDDSETYSAGVLLNIISKPNSTTSLYFLMALLNSRLLNYWYRKTILDVSIRVVDLAKVPIITANSKIIDNSRYESVTTLASNMLVLHQKLDIASTSHEKTQLRRQVEAVDKQIDRLVYALYGLTEEEVRVVEGGW